MSGTFAGVPLTILVGQGDGSLGEARPVPNAVSGSVLSGDFTSDGVEDLVVSTVDSLFLYRSNGDATFQAPVGQLAGEAREPVPGETREATPVAADFNRDGHLDLALIANTGVSVLFGKGDGTFQAQVRYGVGTLGTSEWQSLAAGDLDGDGSLDLIASEQYVGTFLLHGTASGTFGDPVRLGIYGFAGLRIADLDRDGNLDLAGVLRGNTYGLFVYLGNGDTTFRGERQFRSANYSRSLSIADMNADGYLDILVPDTSGYLYMNLNDRSGGFGWASLQATVYAEGTVAADFDADGKLDVVVGSRAGRSRGTFVELFIGKGEGTLREVAVAETGVSYAQGIGCADLDQDGRADLAVADWHGAPGTDPLGHDSLVVLVSSEGGGFSRRSYSVPYHPTAVVTGDLDGDGRADAVVTSSEPGAVSIFDGVADGTFRWQSALSVAGATGVALADFDQDGKTDLAVSAPDSVHIVRSQADGTVHVAGALEGLGSAHYAGTWGGT